MTQLFVLIACEESQAECAAFRALGHYAFSCDLIPCKRGGRPDWHIVQDVSALLRGSLSFVTQSGAQMSVPRWDLIICHPPCTYLTKVGSPYLYKNADTFVEFRGRTMHVNAARWRAMEDARDFFFLCLGARAPYVAVENPIPMAVARLPRPTCYACPSWFGDRYTKKTLYWLVNLPPLMAEVDNASATSLVLSTRGKYRSRTSVQLANALARQWSDYIVNSYSTITYQ